MKLAPTADNSFNHSIDAKDLQNSELPVSCLPVELLSEIFVLTGYTRPKELCTLTAVCHFWRAVAIGTARLWTRIPCDKLEQMEEYLKRSKCLPLDIRMQAKPEQLFDGKREPGYLPPYPLAHLQRIERLTLDFIDIPFTLATFHFGAVVRLCKQPARKLRYLELTRDRTATWDISCHISGLFPEAELSHLKLDRLGISAHSHLLSATLTSLHLSNTRRPAEPLLTPLEMRDVLKRMPGLEHLHLENAFSCGPSLGPAKVLPVHLASLKTLVVRESGYPPGLVEFLTVITFPATLDRLSIRAAGPKGTGPMWDDMDWNVISTLRACTDWDAFYSGEITTLSAEFGAVPPLSDYLCFNGVTDTGVEKFSFQLHAELGAFPDSTRPREVLRELVSSGRIKSIFLGALRETVVEDVFLHGPSTEELSISTRYQLQELVRCLAETHAQKLDKIRITELGLRPTVSVLYVKSENERMSMEEEEWLIQLASALETRRKRGKKISRVTFSKCMTRNIPRRALERLRQVVAVEVVDDLGTEMLQ